MKICAKCNDSGMVTITRGSRGPADVYCKCRAGKTMQRIDTQEKERKVRTDHICRTCRNRGYTSMWRDPATRESTYTWCTECPLGKGLAKKNSGENSKDKAVRQDDPILAHIRGNPTMEKDTMPCKLCLDSGYTNVAQTIPCTCNRGQNIKERGRNVAQTVKPHIDPDEFGLKVPTAQSAIDQLRKAGLFDETPVKQPTIGEPERKTTSRGSDSKEEPVVLIEPTPVLRQAGRDFIPISELRMTLPSFSPLPHEHKTELPAAPLIVEPPMKEAHRMLDMLSSEVVSRESPDSVRVNAKLYKEAMLAAYETALIHSREMELIDIAHEISQLQDMTIDQIRVRMQSRYSGTVAMIPKLFWEKPF